jgi:hypothetical protein
MEALDIDNDELSGAIEEAQSNLGRGGSQKAFVVLVITGKGKDDDKDEEQDVDQDEDQKEGVTRHTRRGE